MIAQVTYRVLGSEPVVAGEREVYLSAASGYRILDIIINGISQDFSAITVDEQTGKVAKPGLQNGDWVSCTYTSLPRYVLPGSGRDFSEADFDIDDFE